MRDKNSNTTIDNDTDTLAPLQLDPHEYRHCFVDEDSTQEQQDEFLEALWHIMRTFVEIGQGVDTVQLFFPDILEKAGPDSEKLLTSNHATEFNQTISNKKGEA